MRDADGTIATFDAPGAGTGAYQGTVAWSIDVGGTIAGLYLDANYFYHGFLRDSSGLAITSFEVPGAGTGTYQGTFVRSIDNSRAITGYYYDANTVSHGFLLTP